MSVCREHLSRANEMIRNSWTVVIRNGYRSGSSQLWRLVVVGTLGNRRVSGDRGELVLEEDYSRNHTIIIDSSAVVCLVVRRREMMPFSWTRQCLDHPRTLSVEEAAEEAEGLGMVLLPPLPQDPASRCIVLLQGIWSRTLGMWTCGVSSGPPSMFCRTLQCPDVQVSHTQIPDPSENTSRLSIV